MEIPLHASGSSSHLLITRFLLFSLLFTISFSPFLKAQQPSLPFKHFTATQGLSQNHVLSITQDRQGFLWFGTAEGLNRFDGYTFTIYKNNSKNPASVCDNNISVMREDRQGNLWIGTGAGLCRYNRQTNSFTSYVHKDDQPHSISTGMINDMLEDRQGNLWLGTSTGMLDLFDRKNNRFIHFPFYSATTSNARPVEVTALLEDRLGNLWVGTRHGIHIMDITRKHTTHYEHQPNDPNNLSNDFIKDIFQDSNGRLWVATSGGGLNQYDYQKRHFTVYQNDPLNSNSLGHNALMCLNEDKEGRLWIGTENGGLDVWDLKKNRFFHYNPNVTNKNSLNDNSIYSIFRDKLDNMWVGTNSKGVNFYDLFMKPFIAYESNPADPTSLSHNKVLAVAEQPKVGIWVATDGGGLNFFNPQTKTFTQYKNDPADPASISSNFVVAVQWDSIAHCLWVATWGGGLDRLDTRTGHFRHYRHQAKDSTSLAADNLWCLHQDRQGTLYVGSIGNGLSVYDRASDRFVNYSGAQGLAEENVISIFRDQKGFLWLGSWGNGITRINLDRKDFTHFNTSKKSPFHISSSTINAITEDKQGKVWFSGGAGFHCYNPQTGRFVTYTDDDGLPGSTVNGALQDQHGNFWLSTNKGLVQFNPTKKSFRTFTVEDGLPTNQFAFRLFKAADGSMYFGSGEGLVVFHPDSIHSNPTVPPVILTDFQIFNKPVVIGSDSPLQQHIGLEKQLTLTHQQSVFSFEFAALNYSFPEKNQYAYKMEGFDTDWNYVGNKRSATYTNLDPGEYVFRVKASNNDGVWNEAGARIQITITPPFWQTWWFRVLMAVLFILLVNVFIWLRIKSYRQQRETLKRLVQRKTREIITKNEVLEKTNLELSKQKEEILKMSLQVKEGDEKKINFFTNISHEFRTPLTLILGPAKQLIDKAPTAQPISEELHIIYKNAHRLLYLVNELMDFHKLDNNHMKIQVVKGNLMAFLSEIVYVFDDLAETKEIQLQFVPDLPQYDTWFDPQKLEIILYNLISNAFKFTHEGGEIKVMVKVNAQADAYEIVVQDNGIGIEEEKVKHIFDRYYQVEAPDRLYQGTGIGLAHTKELTELMEGKITVNSTIGCGSTFTIGLPLLNEEKISNNRNLIEFYSHNPQINYQLFSDLLPVEKPQNQVNGQPVSSVPPILIIDDNTDLRKYIGSCLSAEFQVFEASNGREGLKLAKEIRPKVIVCDLMMPEMNGMEFCHQIKSHLETSHIPVILLTAKTNVESQIEGYETGVDDYIAKPFTSEVLISRIYNLIKSREKLREAFKSTISINPSEISVSSLDEQFLEKALKIVEKFIADPEFGASVLVNELGMSRSVVHRKLKELTALSTGEFIKTIRLKRACQLLREKNLRVSDVCYMVGFTDPDYFRKSFKILYGMSPSQYEEVS